MKGRIACIAATALLLFTATSCSQRDRAPHSSAEGGLERMSDVSAVGAEVFVANCAVCHTLPILNSLFEQNRGRPPGFVYDALTVGNMRRMGEPLDDASRRAVAEFFTGVSFESPEGQRDFSISPPCEKKNVGFEAQEGEELTYPNWGGSPRNHRSTPPASGFTRRDVENLKVDWVVAFPESSQLRSQPTAAGGALFVGSHNGSVYSLDQETGCTYWHFKAATEVRSAVTIDAKSSPRVRAIFADRAANVYAVDATTGEALWTQSVDPHLNAAITGSITSHDGMLFVPVSSNDDINALDPSYSCCTHHGAVVALDAGTGAILWRTPTVREAPQLRGETIAGAELWGPSGASIWNTPTISEKHGLLYVGSGNNHSRPATGMSDSILALELKTGRVVWTYQSQAGDAWNASCLFGTGMSCPTPEGPDTDFGATTMLVDWKGSERLIAGQKSGWLHALDAETGKLFWKVRVAPGGAEGGIRYGMSTRDGVIYVPSADEAQDDSDSPSREPGVYALSVADGSILWETTGSRLCEGQSACNGAVAAPPFTGEKVLFAAGLEGVLYGIDRLSGEVFWNFDTARSFDSLAGRKTQGGGIAGTAGPMVANGRLFVSSGYGQAQRPGNALIAFSPSKGDEPETH
jgi:polyvinyl alcohol dehydrogenase (cytochrome)